VGGWAGWLMGWLMGAGVDDKLPERKGEMGGGPVGRLACGARARSFVLCGRARRELHQERALGGDLHSVAPLIT